jgi:hypothetical protein
VGKFNEQSLLAAIEAKWGDHGAHADVFRFMLSEIDVLRSVAEKVCGIEDFTANERAAIERARRSVDG